MALQDDLLEQADHLARRERTKPRQASLRRAVSAAYYALFHQLAHDVVRRTIPGSPLGMRTRARRALDHRSMKEVCKQFSSGGMSKVLKELIAPPMDPKLGAVAGAFVNLQEARHDADYNVEQSLDRASVSAKVAKARQAFLDWKAVRKTPNAAVFLAALLLHKRWNR